MKANQDIPPYTQRFIDARTTKIGDNWRRIKDGKAAIVIARIGCYGIGLLHESGKKTTKQDHYLASEFYLVTNPNQPNQ